MTVGNNGIGDKLVVDIKANNRPFRPAATSKERFVGVDFDRINGQWRYRNGRCWCRSGNCCGIGSSCNSSGRCHHRRRWNCCCRSRCCSGGRCCGWRDRWGRHRARRGRSGRCWHSGWFSNGHLGWLAQALEDVAGSPRRAGNDQWLTLFIWIDDHDKGLSGNCRVAGLGQGDFSSTDWQGRVRHQHPIAGALNLGLAQQLAIGKDFHFGARRAAAGNHHRPIGLGAQQAKCRGDQVLWNHGRVGWRGYIQLRLSDRCLLGRGLRRLRRHRRRYCGARLGWLVHQRHFGANADAHALGAVVTIDQGWTSQNTDNDQKSNRRRTNGERQGLFWSGFGQFCLPGNKAAIR